MSINLPDTSRKSRIDTIFILTRNIVALILVVLIVPWFYYGAYLTGYVIQTIKAAYKHGKDVARW